MSLAILSMTTFLYFESAREAIFSQGDTEEIGIYRQIFEDLRKASLGPEGSLKYLAEVMDIIL